MKASFLVRCSQEDKLRWEALAKAEGRSLNNWVERQLNAAETQEGPCDTPQADSVLRTSYNDTAGATFKKPSYVGPKFQGKK